MLLNRNAYYNSQVTEERGKSTRVNFFQSILLNRPHATKRSSLTIEKLSNPSKPAQGVFLENKIISSKRFLPQRPKKIVDTFSTDLTTVAADMKLHLMKIFRYWKLVLLVLVPVVLLPIPILDGTVTFRCAYVAIIMAVYW